MATPWIHPETGVYHLRRQIPKELRPAFGGRTLYKKSLRTKDVTRAPVLFVEANAELERRFEEARGRLRRTGSPAPSSRDQADELVLAYFNGPEFIEGGLDGSERLELARFELDRGLWNATENGLSYPQPVDEQDWWALSNNAARYRDWNGRRPVRQHSPGTIWSWDDTVFRHGARTQQVERVIAQIARYSGMDQAGLPTALPEAIKAFLSAQPIGPSAERRARSTGSRLRPDLRMTELFDEWKAKLQPSEQTAHEFEASMRDFIEMHGDIRVSEVVDDDLLNYRDEAAKLPRSMPRSDRTLPFTVRVAKHTGNNAQCITSATLKKRVGALKALLSFAFKQKWVTTNVGVSIPIEGYSRDSSLKPNNFDESQLASVQLDNGECMTDF